MLFATLVARWFKASFKDPWCANSVFSEPASLSISRSKRVTRIVFNQQYVDRQAGHLFAARGNLTLVSQKSLMLFTSASNASNCTGFVR
jgi:hypothetical protein